MMALAKIRHEQPEQPKNLNVDHIVEQAKIMSRQRIRRAKLAERLPDALIEWGKEG